MLPVSAFISLIEVVLIGYTFDLSWYYIVFGTYIV